MTLTLKSFPDHWHTVPLNGELIRLPNSTKKNIPQFRPDWKNYYTTHHNEQDSPLGGVLTGAISNIIAIDCDNALTFSIFTSLDPSPPYSFTSKGKDGGTIIYEYTTLLPDTFRNKRADMALDFFSNNGFIYLPTINNHTKHTPATPPPAELSPPPPAVIAMLHLMQTPPAPPLNESQNNDNMYTANFLQPLVHMFCENRGRYMPGLFRIITPRSFRTHSQYLTHHHLHPNDIPNGDGSHYLSKVSAILGSDISISPDLYAETMANINNLFDDPMEPARLEQTIVKPMLEGKAKIDSSPIWQYNKDWKKYRSLFRTKDESVVEIVYDDNNTNYYCIDTSRATYQTFHRDSDLYNHLQALTATPVPKKEIIHAIPLVHTVTKPHNPFGLNPGSDATKREFNTFRATPALSIFYDPQSYSKKYTHPQHTLNFLRSLVPDTQMRDYLLSFLHTKLTTFNYSPTILYFLGVPGSGKGTFVAIIEKIFGSVPAPTAKEFLDKFNAWVIGAYFAELDEYGNSLSTLKDKEEAIGKLKAITGKSKIDIRRMRTDSYTYQHNLTFIMTANKNPLMLDEDDRRIALFNTPNILADESWVINSGGVGKVREQILSEVPDFCYYLATRISPLSSEDYTRPPSGQSKFRLIADSLPAAQRIAYAFKTHNINYIKELHVDYALDATYLSNSEFSLDELNELYLELTNNKGTRRALLKVLRENATHLHIRRAYEDFMVSNHNNKPFEDISDEND